MLIGDLLASHATRPYEFAWVGAAVTDHPALAGLAATDGAPGDPAGSAPAGAAVRAPVRVAQVRVAPVRVTLVRTGSPDWLDGLAWLDDLAEGDRAVLLTDALPAEPVACRLATALAAHGCELLHAAYIDDASGIGVTGGLSVQRTPPHPDRGDLAGTNLRIVTADDGGPDWARARAAFARVAAGHEAALAAARQATAELRAVADQRDTATGAGPGAGAAGVGERVDDGRGGRLRRVWRARGGGRTPSPSGQAPGVRTVTALRRRPRVAGESARATRRLDFRAPMPIPPGRTRPRPRPLRIDAPAADPVARALKRAGVGGYQPAATAWFLALCDTARPGAVWDVGAGIGPYALLAAAYSGREVIGFEPAPDLAARAGHLSVVNGLRYRMERLAAGERAATVTIGDPSERPVEVLVEPLDRYARRTGSAPAIIRIGNATGWAGALRGATRTVAEHRPWIVGAGPAGDLPELGYRRHVLDGAAGVALFSPAELGVDTVAAARAWATALELTPPPAR